MKPEPRHLLKRLNRNTYGAAPGSIPERPVWLHCDCCCEKCQWLEFRKHYDFCVMMPWGGGREFMEGQWAFCTQCRALLGRPDLLVARVMMLNPDLDPVAVSRTYTALAGALYGEPIAWESGQRHVSSGGN